MLRVFLNMPTEKGGLLVNKWNFTLMNGFPECTSSGNRDISICLSEQ
jgi:hypothetical protein